VGDAAGSKSKPLADQISGAGLLTALIWCFGALALALYGQDAMEFVVMDEAALALSQPLAGALLASGLACTVLGRWFWRRLQGFTGDCLGTTQQVCEIAFYFGLALAL
jgi:adenosylcobinamide-GDP ribazoletransferase